jgi:hypothetical protein
MDFLAYNFYSSLRPFVKKTFYLWHKERERLWLEEQECLWFRRHSWLEKRNRSRFKKLWHKEQEHLWFRLSWLEEQDHSWFRLFWLEERESSWFEEFLWPEKLIRINKGSRSIFSKISESYCPDWIITKSIERKSLPRFSLCNQVEEPSKESKRSKLPVPDT